MGSLRAARTVRRRVARWGVALALGNGAVACAALVGADFDGLLPRQASTARDGGTGDGGSLDTSEGYRIETREASVELLGLSVAVAGDTAFVGARDADWAGLLYRVERDSSGVWVVRSKLTAEADAAPNAQFGCSVSLSGDELFVGAQGIGLPATAGAAYVFRRSGAEWARVARLTPPESIAGDGYGTRVVVEEGTAAIGAPGDAAGLPGSVYLYRRDVTGGWTLWQRLSDPGQQPGGAFGTEVALHGTTLVATAPGVVEGGTQVGVAYVFERRGDTWALAQTLRPQASGATTYRFGDGTVGLGDGVALIPTLGAATGLFAYSRDATGAWRPDVLDAPVESRGRSGFGWRTTISGALALVAVRTGVEPDHALLYRRQGGAWRLERRFAPALESADFFGWTVSLDGQTALVGSVGYRRQDGAAYFFDAGG